MVRREFADDPEFRRRFRQEVASAQRVQGLYTAPVVDADPDAPVPWLATAYIAGPALNHAVSEYGPLPELSVFRLLGGVAEGLGAVHAVIAPAVLVVLLAVAGGGAYLGFDLKSKNSPQGAGATTPTAKASLPSAPAANSAAAAPSTSASAPASPLATAAGAVPSAPPSDAVISSTEYSTPDPFPLCDPNGGQWLLVNMTPQSGGCVPNMQADANNSGYMFGTVSSFPHDIPLTEGNTVTVSGVIDAPGPLDCLGPAEGSATGGYIGLLCNNGQWYINSVVNLGTNGVVVGKQLATGSYPYSSDTTYDISLTFASGTAKLGVTFSQGSASPLTETFSTGQFTPNAVGYALSNANGNGYGTATIAGFTYAVN